MARSQRAAPSRRQTVLRSLLPAACLVLLTVSGVALASTSPVRYFAGPDRQPLPAAVRRALAFAAAHGHPAHPLRLSDALDAFVFRSGSERDAIYLAPYAGNGGFCAALTTAAGRVQTGCLPASPLPSGDPPQTATSLTGRGLWSFALTPRVHALLGRLAATAAGDRVEVTFEDGSEVRAPRHGRWFAYAVFGKRTVAGHRPSAWRVVDRRGVVVWHEQLRPAGFNTLTAARALVPHDDGSLGQRAVREYLLAHVGSRAGDGGEFASHADIRRTQRIVSLNVAGRVRFSLFATPLRAGDGMPRGGTLLLGLSGRASRPALALVVADDARPRRFGTDGRPYGCTCALPGHPAITLAELADTVPRGVAAVGVRTADGREHAAQLFDRGRQWVWIGHGDPAARPVALVGRDAGGRVVLVARLRR